MRLSRILVLALAALIVSAGSAQADPISLLTLINSGGSIQAGDKTFSNFGYSCLAGNCVGEGTIPANITVDAFIDAGTGGYVLQFGGDMIANTFVDFKLQYRVSASAGLIVSIGQAFNLTAPGSIGGQILIGEQVYSGGFMGTTEAHSSVGFITNALGDFEDPIAEGDDLIVSPGRSVLFIEKDVQLAPFTGGVVGTSILKQSFIQTVPEPTSLLLLGTGLIGMAFWRRRSN